MSYKYKENFYIVSGSIDSLKVEASAMSASFSEVEERIRMIAPVVPAKAKGGGILIKIDRECVKLLDSINADALMKTRLLTRAQAVAARYDNLEDITGKQVKEIR